MRATWITATGDEHRPNLYFRARRRLDLDRVTPGQRLHIAAESYYKLWVNGRALGEGPARGSRTLNFYDTYDISGHLAPGVNWIGVLVQSMNRPNYVSFPVAAALTVDVEGCPGDWETLVTGEWSDQAPLLCPQIGFSQWRDLRLSPEGWELGRDASPWEPARALAPAGEPFYGKELLPRPVAPLRKRVLHPAQICAAARIASESEVPPVDVAEAMTREGHTADEDLRAACQALTLASGESVALPTDGGEFSVTLDFGETVIGFLEVELTAQDGTVVDIGYDEELFDGRLVAARGEYRMADRTTTRRGRQTLGSELHERGFRFVQLSFRNPKGPLTLHKISAVDRRYPWPSTGAFHCSDHRLNRIWNVCLETLSACTTDVFNDCPWRERAFWVNDLLVENRATLQAFGDARMNAHALRLALSNRREDGVVPGVCPDTGDPRLVLAATNALLPIILKDYLLYTGDRGLAAELLPVMEEVLDVMEGWRSEGGLLAPPHYWNFIDWSYHLLGVKLEGKRSSLLEGLYVLGRQSAAWLEKELGRGDGERHGRLAAETFAAIQDRFWNAAAGRLMDWEGEAAWNPMASSQLTHALARLTGLLPAAKASAAREALDDGALRIPELYLHHFLFQAMDQAGMGKAALDRIRRYWGAMVDRGAKTLWEYGVYPEGFKSPTKAASNCHGFGAAPVAYFQESLLGVRPLTPGFKTFSFDPNPHDLDGAEGRIPTPRGPIRVEWKREGDGLLAQLQVPAGCVAFVGQKAYPTGLHTIPIQRKKP
ncbi:MAG: hypothetical protein J0L75_07280 [Spirochaetes bacterium]|nr:hypothetical protein [Spirochaetota bacterium]